MNGGRNRSGGLERGSLSHQLLDLPMGVLAIRIFLWLITVLALSGALMLLVLRPSLVFTSDSPKPLESRLSDNQASLAGVVCSFPTSEE